MKRGSALVGVLVMVVGLAMIGVAFTLAYQLFTVPPTQAMKIVPGQEIDLGKTGEALFQVLVRVLMLVLMAGFGSLFANRGIKLYEAARATRPPPGKTD